ncbi:MAG: rhodanese-like domain-containing protein [Sulfurimonas sp.]|nr:rhodanese-like domain-containing protein [Sulfurimonas sp.]
MQKILINILSLILLSSAIYAIDFSQRDRLIAEARAEVPFVTPKKLNDMLEDEEELIILDIREVEQRAEGTIPTLDTYEITRGQLEFKIMILIEDKNTKIVSFCRDGPRSAIASRTLINMGYKNATYLKGGLKAWAVAGYKIKNGLGRVVLNKEDEF